MKLKSPITKYKDEPIYITLPYGDKSFLDAYKRLGWDLAFHNGLDCVNSVDPIRAYGSPVLATQDGVVQKVAYETSLTAKGNGLTIEGLPFIKDDKKMLLTELHWHLSDVCVKAGDFVKAGQKVGSLGNSGFSVGGDDSPMKGTHDHFGVFLYVFNEAKKAWELACPDNGVQGAVNPEDWLEENWRTNAPVYEPQGLFHAEEIVRIIAKSIEVLKNWFKGR